MCAYYGASLIEESKSGKYQNIFILKIQIHDMNRSSIFCAFILALSNFLNVVNIRSPSSAIIDIISTRWIEQLNMKSHKIFYSILIHAYVCPCVLNRNGLYIEFEKLLPSALFFFLVNVYVFIINSARIFRLQITFQKKIYKAIWS